MEKVIKDTYRDLCMMRDRINGASLKEVALAWGCTTRTASRHIKLTASECMRQAMEQTQGDPDHPSTPRFTVEEFTKDPRAAMVAIMEEHISRLEKQFPGLDNSEV